MHPVAGAGCPSANASHRRSDLTSSSSPFCRQASLWADREALAHELAGTARYRARYTGYTGACARASNTNAWAQTANIL